MAVQQRQAFLPFGPLLRISLRPLLQEDSQPLVSDGMFVWGPNVEGFDLAAYLEATNSPLAPHAEELALWSSYASVNPQVLLAVLEVRYGLVSGIGQALDDPRRSPA